VDARDLDRRRVHGRRRRRCRRRRCRRGRLTAAVAWRRVDGERTRRGAERDDLAARGARSRLHRSGRRRGREVRMLGRNRERMESGLLERARETPADAPVHAARHERVGRRWARDNDRRSRVHGRRAAPAMRDPHADSGAEDGRKQQPKDHTERHVNRVGFRWPVLSLVWGISPSARAAEWPKVGVWEAQRPI
jgi:hypothetical protein